MKPVRHSPIGLRIRRIVRMGVPVVFLMMLSPGCRRPPPAQAPLEAFVQLTGSRPPVVGIYDTGEWRVRTVNEELNGVDYRGLAVERATDQGSIRARITAESVRADDSVNVRVVTDVQLELRFVGDPPRTVVLPNGQPVSDHVLHIEPGTYTYEVR